MSRDDGDDVELYDRPEAIGFLHYASGHRPPEEAMATAYRWLAEQFGLPELEWSLQG